MFLGILGWLLLGLVAGFIAGRFVNLRNDDPGIGYCVGALAAVIGGWLCCAISGSPVSAFNAPSLLFAGLAAVAGLLTWHMWRGRASRA